MGPPRPHETGHFYFAQTGHSHFAATSFTRAAMWVLFLLAWPSALFAQLGTAKGSAIVQRDTSTTSPILERLDEGDRVVLVDLSPDSGFYHVRTEDDKVGWVLVNDITVSKAPEQTPPEEVAPMENAAPSAIAAKAPPKPAGACDATLWKHVYHANRLIVKKQCIEVTGIMVDATAPLKSKQPDGVRHEPDGDTHGWLQVDPQFKNYSMLAIRAMKAVTWCLKLYAGFP